MSGKMLALCHFAKFNHPSPPLSGRETVAHHAYDNHPYAHLWPSFHENSFQYSQFLKICSDVKLKSDQIMNIETFYNQLLSKLRAAHSHNKKILPPFQHLSSSTSIYDSIIPPPSHPHHEQVAKFLDLVSDALKTVLTNGDAINPEKAVLTSINLTSSSQRPGLSILYYLLAQSTPFLGVTLVNLDAMICNLKIEKGSDTLHKFLHKAISIEQTIKASGKTVTPNSLLECILSILRTIPQLNMIITNNIISFNNFKRTYGINTVYKSDT